MTQTKLIVRTFFNARNQQKKYEANYEPSKTIPDQTMSLKEILDRHSRGLTLENAKVPIYHGDEPLPDFAKMDLTEIALLKKDVRDYITKHQENLEYLDKQEKEKLEQERIEQIKKQAIEDYKTRNTKETE